MLIVKNFFNFYVEFEILLYFKCFRVFGVKEHDIKELKCR
jgi:formate hydrogenlyase subunit 3/multisubunit Na+/H+ antiporter MnhD subunit